jgi:hypothetical protein
MGFLLENFSCQLLILLISLIQNFLEFDIFSFDTVQSHQMALFYGIDLVRIIWLELVSEHVNLLFTILLNVHQLSS